MLFIDKGIQKQILYCFYALFYTGSSLIFAPCYLSFGTVFCTKTNKGDGSSCWFLICGLRCDDLVNKVNVLSNNNPTFYNPSVSAMRCYLHLHKGGSIRFV